MVFNVCVQFHENMSRGFKIMVWTQKLLHTKGNNSKSRKTRVTVHVFCKPVPDNILTRIIF